MLLYGSPFCYVYCKNTLGGRDISCGLQKQYVIDLCAQFVRNKGIDSEVDNIFQGISFLKASMVKSHPLNYSASCLVLLNLLVLYLFPSVNSFWGSGVFNK